MIEEAAEYRFEDIAIGMKKRFPITVNETMVEEFAKISGDYNPLHMNEKYTRSTKFGKRICHGMLMASFFSKLIGMHLPGKNSLYFSQSLNFLVPCYIDDEITIEGEVIDKSPSTRMVTLKTSIYNQSGICLIEGIAKVIVRENVLNNQ
jgi:3-hydroxybutyryl-CoA dehydratase